MLPNAFEAKSSRAGDLCRDAHILPSQVGKGGGNVRKGSGFPALSGRIRHLVAKVLMNIPFELVPLRF